MILAIINCTVVFGQGDIRYHNKPLVKTLQKFGINSYSLLDEITIPGSVDEKNSIQGKYFEYKTDTEVSQIRYIYIGRVNSCRAGGCSISNNSSQSLDSEYFDYFILFDKNKTIQLVKIFNYQATHGQEVTARGWLKQFIGYDSSVQLEVDKNIDTISGATISVYAITHDVEVKREILTSLIDTY